MFTIIVRQYIPETDRQYIEAACNSDDEKLEYRVATGSSCIEVDTGKVFFFDEDASDQKWKEV